MTDLLLLRAGQPSWRDEANCRDIDPDLFFPLRGEDIGRAKAVCWGCAVREECLEYALDNNEEQGIWGGLSGKERKRLRRQRNLLRLSTEQPKPVEVELIGRMKPIEHGTPRGYQAHSRRGEQACTPCREAAAAYKRAMSSAASA